MTDLAYWKKLEKPDENILWSLPEQKSGKIQVIGGNANSFAGVIKLAEELSAFPVKDVQLLLPDALRAKVPPLPNITFADSTESGSFKKSPILDSAISSSGENSAILLAGDFSKNSATSVALAHALSKSQNEASAVPSSEITGVNIKNIQPPVVLAKDSLDLLISEPEILTSRPLVILASLAQLQNLFRSLYYPKMLLLSSPLLPVLETLHKFTLTYENLTLLTFHQGKIIITKAGKVITIDLADTFYNPITLWTSLPAKVAALNLWNPSDPLNATATACLWNPRSKEH